MGHKEDLLAGAKACLVDIGYARTTARDIVAASHTNLASIGYHFGSKDALLAQAMMELAGEWAERFAGAAAEAGARTTPERFRSTLTQLLKLFKNERAVTLASIDIAVQAARSNELGKIFIETWPMARLGLVDDFVVLEDADERTRRAVGGLLLALISGLTIQYVIDPDGTPDADDLTLAMKTIARAFRDDGKGKSWAAMHGQTPQG